MQTDNEVFQFTPSNWLYNAGVVGLITCLDRNDYLTNYSNNYKYWLNDDGSLNINKDIFAHIEIESNYLKDGKVINLKGKNRFYPNFLAAKGTQNDAFKTFVKLLTDATQSQNNIEICAFCGDGKYINSTVNDNEFKKTFRKAQDI
jgi:hypothetical protein